MDRPVSIVLSGIGGYGEAYLSGLLEPPEGPSFRFVGAADPEPERCSRLAELRAAGIPVLPSLEGLYERCTPDLAVIAAPIQLHCEQTCLALSRGSHVLCEKPAAATVQEVDGMLAASRRASRFVAIGFQWSFSAPILELASDIRSGLYGPPRRLKSLTLWPRDEAYYRRNGWAGRLRDGEGRWILDSPANNAMAHDLHNLLFLLGEEEGRSAVPVEVQAETYRAKAIESFDTVALRARTAGGAEVLFYASHSTSELADPIFEIELSQAAVRYRGGEAPIEARRGDGSIREYPSPQGEPHLRKLWTCVRAAATGGTPPCGLEAARAHTLCVNGIAESAPDPGGFPAERVRRLGGADRRLTCVEGLAEQLQACYREGALPSELGLPWARAGKTVDLRGYASFPAG